MSDEACSIPMLLLKDQLFSEYRKFFVQYNNLAPNQYNVITASLNELWGIWLKDKSHLMECHDDQPIDTEFITSLLKIELEKFFEQIRTKIADDKLIKNPTYQILEATSNNNIKQLQKAVDLDPDFAFPALYRKALLEVSKVKKHEALASFNAALANLNDIIIPLYEQGMQLAKVGGAEYHDPIIKQYKDLIEIYTAYINNIQYAISKIETVKDVKRGGIYLSKFHVFEQHLPDADTMEDEINDIKDLGLEGYAEIDYYISPKKKSFLGNFVSIVLSVVQIAVGSVVGVASGGFLSYFSSGLIANGIKDIIFTSLATIEGKGLEFSNVIRGLSIDLAVNTIMAGLKTLANTVAAKMAASNPEGSWQHKLATNIQEWTGAKDIHKTKFDFAKQVHRDTMVALTSRAFEEVAHATLSTQKRNIESDVYHKVKHMLSRHNSELTRLAAHDLWRGDHQAERALIHEGETTLAEHYLPGYRQIHQKILREVGGRLPYIGGALTAYEVADTFNQVMSLSQEFCEEFEYKIAAYVPNDERLMHARLGRFSAKNNKIITSMLNQNAFPGGKINCEQELNLGLYQNELSKVKEACQDVVGLNAEGVAGYQEKLTKDLAKIITSHIIYMIEQGIIHPLSIYAGSHIVEKFQAQAKLEQAQLLTEEEKEGLANLMDKLDEESNLTPNQLRAIKDGYRPVQLGNKLMFFNDQTGQWVDIDKLYSEVKETKPKVKVKAKDKPTQKPTASSTYNIAEQFKPSQTMKELGQTTSLDWLIPTENQVKLADEHVEAERQKLNNEYKERFAKVYNSNQMVVFKTADTVAMIINYGLDNAVLMTKESFATLYPKTYNDLVKFGDQVGEFAAFIIDKADGKLVKEFGQDGRDKIVEAGKQFMKGVGATSETYKSLIKVGAQLVPINYAKIAASKVVDLSKTAVVSSSKALEKAFVKSMTKADAPTPKVPVKTKPATTPKPTPKAEPAMEVSNKPGKGTVIAESKVHHQPKAEMKQSSLKAAVDAPQSAPKIASYEFANSKGTMSHMDDVSHVKSYDIHQTHKAIQNDWGNKPKDTTIRKEVPQTDLQSASKYGKMKEELGHEAHLGHGDASKLAENHLSFKDVKKFGGELVNDLISSPEFKEIAGKWGVGYDGTNQLIEHTAMKKPGRIADIAERIGIETEELTNIFSKDSAKKIQALQKFDEVSDQVIVKATLKNTNLKGGKQEAYYITSLANPEEGVIVLKYKDKKATMMPGTYKYFDDHFGVKP